MKNEEVVAILGLLGIGFSQARHDLPIAGSPDRCLERLAAEDRDGREMVDLEAVFIGLLLENREALLKAWG